MSKYKYNFYSETIWVSFTLIVLLLFGYAIGYPWFLFSIGLSIYLFWHLRQLIRLVRWLSVNELDMPPDAKGLWGDVFRHLYRIQRHNRHRHEKMVLLLKRYKKSTKAMPDAIIILGKKWEIEWLNPKCKTYFDLKKKQAVGKKLTNLIRNPIFLDFVENYNKENNNNQKTLEIPSPDDKKILSIRMISYEDKHLLIARDITRMTKLKTMRKDFVANVSHELKTPLTVILGYLEVLEDHLQKEPLYANSIQLMQQQSHRMCHIVDDLLLLSTIESNELKSLKNDFIDMHGLTMMLKKEALVLSRGDHKIEVLCSGVKWLKGDQNELQSAFSNLVSNAVKYTPKEGDIIIRWYSDESNQGCFEVQDSGEGISKHHLERLTERFYRVDVGRSRETGGTGLGLAIVKHVINHHKGKLVVKSEVGVGSIFRCEFSAKMLKAE